jgi:hypothetical protein
MFRPQSKMLGVGARSLGATMFYVFESRAQRYAKIHRADCYHCNNGEGTQGNAFGLASKWRGPFKTYRTAVRAANIACGPVTCCRTCRPEQ